MRSRWRRSTSPARLAVPVIPVVLLAVPLTALLAPQPVAQELSDATFEKWRDFVVPEDDELGWSGIAWRPTLADGLLEGQRVGKPVLVWAMNGHPLGLV